MARHLKCRLRSSRTTDHHSSEKIDVGAAPAGWTEHDIRAIQKALHHLGLYRNQIDGLFGPSTSAGLVEAFGGDEWKKLSASDALMRVKAAHNPPGRRGQHRLRLGEMFRDGVLDITVGVGYQEVEGLMEYLRSGVTDELLKYGFEADTAKAMQLYAQANHKLPPKPIGEFFVRKVPLVYTPPAGAPRPVQVVVRVIANPSATDGAEALQAFQRGMNQSDISYYTGHGRYGSGPDFDLNYKIEVLQDGKWAQLDHEEIEPEMKAAARKHGRSAWDEFLVRVKEGKVRAQPTNAGNLLMNAKPHHQSEFGGRLQYWALEQLGQPPVPATGPKGTLADRDRERRYHLWVFDGCSTVEYEKSIRSTPHQGPRQTDIIDTKRPVRVSDSPPVLGAFLESVLAQHSAEQIILNMDQKNQHLDDGRTHPMHLSGAKDDPVVP